MIDYCDKAAFDKAIAENAPYSDWYNDYSERLAIFVSFYESCKTAIKPESLDDALIRAIATHNPKLRTTVGDSLIDVITEKMANGWEHGTHPREKARIVLDAIRQHGAAQQNPSLAEGYYLPKGHADHPFTADPSEIRYNGALFEQICNDLEREYKKTDEHCRFSDVGNLRGYIHLFLTRYLESSPAREMVHLSFNEQQAMNNALKRSGELVSEPKWTCPDCCTRPCSCKFFNSIEGGQS